jgi:uncharacterized protein (TIGR02594 family)
MKNVILILFIVFLCSCSNVNNQPNYLDTVDTAGMMLGMHERKDRTELKRLMGVDPVTYEWCAAFVNMILNLHGINGSESVSNSPLMARSFLQWGQSVEKANIMRGDIVVFPRGNKGWQGHVGFYVETINKNGIDYYVILGGNQDDNSVSVDIYPASRAIGIRRQTSA